MEPKKLEIEFAELLKHFHFDPRIVDPVPPFYILKFLDEGKLMEIAKLEIKYRMNDLKNRMDHLEDVRKML